MPKRFTDTNKWADPWFRRLKPRLKLFWQYICDNCDNAGVWKIDYEIASFYIGEQVGNEDIPAINQDKERLILANSHYLVVKDFIHYQIGNIKSKELTNLQKNCNSIINQYFSKGIDIVKMVNITGKLPVTIRYKHKDKGNSKDISKDNTNNIIPDFISSLKTNPAYIHINLEVELGKMDAWLLLNPGRQKTKRFVLRWLNKIEKPLPTQIPTTPIDTSIKYRAKIKQMEEEAALVDPAEVKKLLDGVKNKIGNFSSTKNKS